MAVSESLQVGIVLERSRIDHPWKEYSWRAVDVLPGSDPDIAWKLLRDGEDSTLFLARTLTLELHPRETEGYKESLNSAQPGLYVVLRPGEEEDDNDVEPFLITACPFEAQDYMDSGEESVDSIPIPPELHQWIADFVDRHHVEQVFKKRKRTPQESSLVRRKPVIGGSHG